MTPAQPMQSMERFQGGKRELLVAAGVGAVGLVLTGVGGALDARRALFAYLMAFVYWVGISVAGLILLATFHASRARWMVVLRRPLEVMSISSAAFPLLFVPIALGMRQLFVWVDPSSLSEEARHHLEHKHVYLNVPAFLGRAALYFGVWIVISHLLHRWSTRQDESGEAALLVWQRRLGTGSLPLLAITVTFAAFDWLMSLTPLWQSTIFGVYYFAGSFLAAIAAWTLLSSVARGKDLFGSLVTGAHLHNLGKLLLTFTAFWAYIAFSQYLLVWVGNLPEESPYYEIRASGSWRWVFIALVVGHFVLPFSLLLSRALKLRPGFLAAVAVLLLLARWVDVYWLVMPAMDPKSPSLHWTDLTAFAGVGGAAVAFALFRARGRYTVPVKDPFLADSLRYTQP